MALSPVISSITQAETKPTEGAFVQISDILRNNVKEKLARDEVVASMTVRLVRNVEIARIARTAGFDTLYIDLEHSSFSLESCSQVCIAAMEAGIAPFVRVPANTPDYITRVLEGGALGIIAPHVHSAADAQRGGPGGQVPSRWASARTPPGSRTCTSVASRRPRPTRRSTTPPW